MSHNFTSADASLESRRNKGEKVHEPVGQQESGIDEHQSGKESGKSGGPYRYVSKAHVRSGESGATSDANMSKSHSGDGPFNIDSDDNLSCCDNISVESLTLAQSQTAIWGASASNNLEDSENSQTRSMVAVSFSENSLSNTGVKLSVRDDNGRKNGAVRLEIDSASAEREGEEEGDSIQDDLSYNQYHNSDNEIDDNDNSNFAVISGQYAEEINEEVPSEANKPSKK